MSLSKLTKYCACHEKWISWLILVKRYLQCTEQQVSLSKLTKYCACHAKWLSKISDKFLENSWNVISNAGPIRAGSENDPSRIRPWNRRPQPASQPRLLFAPTTSILYWKIQHFALRLSFQNTAPATKSDTWTSPNTAPATENDIWTSPKAAPATKSDTWTSANKAMTWLSYYLTELWLDWAMTWLSYDLTELWLDWAMTWLSYDLTELWLDWAMTWMSYYLTELLLDWAITWLSFTWLSYDLTELWLDWAMTWLSYDLTELLLDWAMTWLSYYLTELWLDWAIELRSHSYIGSFSTKLPLIMNYDTFWEGFPCPIHRSGVKKNLRMNKNSHRFPRPVTAWALSTRLGLGIFRWWWKNDPSWPWVIQSTGVDEKGYSIAKYKSFMSTLGENPAKS